MGMFAKFSPKAALLAAVAGLGVAGSAHAASPVATLTVNGNAVTGAVPGLALDAGTGKYDFNGTNDYVYVDASGAFTGTGTSATVPSGSAYSFHVEVIDNAPGLPTGAQLFDTTHEVRAGIISTPSVPVTITITDSTFAQPAGSVFLRSSVNGSYLTGGATTTDGTFQSTYTGSAGTVTTSLQTVPNSSTFNTVNSPVFSSTGGFTLTNTVTFSLVGGENDVARTQTYLLPAAVPEPATMALALSGLGAIGLVRLRRRRLLITA